MSVLLLCYSIVTKPSEFFDLREVAVLSGKLLEFSSLCIGNGEEGAPRKKQGQLGEELPLFRAQSTKSPGLGEVIAEGGEYHIVYTLGGDGGTASRHTTGAGPGVLD
jgi:hypothetical protein